MSKVLFELNFGEINNVEAVTDYLTEVFSNYMLKVLAQSVPNLGKDFNNNIGMFSLSEFIYECNDLQKKALVYKLLLDRLYPVIVKRDVIYLCELDCFRPGYIAYADAQDFTKILNDYIKDLLQNTQVFLKNKGFGVPKDVRLDIRYILNLTGVSKIGIRDLSKDEVTVLQMPLIQEDSK